MTRNILKNDQGVVLVLVLIILVAAIIMGVMTIRTTSLDSRMAGNDRRYITNFNSLESSITYVLLWNTAALKAVGTNIGQTYTYPVHSLPGDLSDVTISVKLEKMKAAPRGSGNDTDLSSRYYILDAEDENHIQHLTVGAYKVLPQL
jgi:hypothetical protein